MVDFQAESELFRLSFLDESIQIRFGNGQNLARINFGRLTWPLWDLADHRSAKLGLILDLTGVGGDS